VRFPGRGSAAVGFAADAPATLYSYLGTIEGSVEVQKPGSDVWTLGKLGESLPGGTQIKTQTGAACTVAFTDGTKLRIGPNATFKIEEVSVSKVSVFIGLGKLEAWVKKLAAGRTFQARNPVAVAAVRGHRVRHDRTEPHQRHHGLLRGLPVGLWTTSATPPAVAQGQHMEANATTGASAPAPIPPAAAKPPVEPTVTVAPPPPPPPPPAPKQAQTPPAAAAAARSGPGRHHGSPAAASAAAEPAQETQTSKCDSTVSPSSPDCH